MLNVAESETVTLALSASVTTQRKVAVSEISTAGCVNDVLALAGAAIVGLIADE